jgi:hypothetical protein
MTTPVEHALARQLILEVKIDDVWTKVRFASEIAPAIEPGFEDGKTYDDNGWAHPEKTALEWTLEFVINLYRDAAGNFLPEAEYFRSAGRVFGADGHVTVRWYDAQGGQEAHEGTAEVTYARAETGNDALAKASVTLTGKGPLLDITNPLAA